MCLKCKRAWQLDVPPWHWDPVLSVEGSHLCKYVQGWAKTCSKQKSKGIDRAFVDEVVKAHNSYRQKHQAGPLRHAEDLSVQAQKWAEHLAETNNFQHSSASLKGEKLGENIAMKWSSMIDSYSGEEVTEQWYSEIKQHQFGKEPRSMSSGHFTQVVWRGTREVGVGKAQSSDGKIIVVANYRPAGNILGQFTDNVLPPKEDCRKYTSKASIGQPKLESRSRSETQVRKEHSSGISYSPITAKKTSSKMSESRSVRTFTETTGSGANKVTKTVVEETIIKADGSKVTNRKETVTHGDSGGSKDSREAVSLFDDKKKDKDKGGAFSEMPEFGKLRLHDNDRFFKSKDKDKKRRSSSSSDSSPERSKKPQKIKDFIDDCVKVHNEYRKKHGVCALKHAKDLSMFAQKWADHLAATNSFQHSDCNHKGDRLGENIACKWSSGGGDYTGQEVCDQWYSEIKKHDFGTEPRSLGSGHFTQMVWKGSTEIGVGKAKTSGGKVIVVASYRPAGNLVGSFTQNVLKPK